MLNSDTATGYVVLIEGLQNEMRKAVASNLKTAQPFPGYHNQSKIYLGAA